MVSKQALNKQAKISKELREQALNKLARRLQSPRLRSPGTISSYGITANIFLNWLKHDPPATPEDFRDFFTWRREKKNTERTLRKEFFHIKKLAEANDWAWPFIKEDAPVSKQKPFAPSHSIADIQKIIAARNKFTKAERFFLAVSTTWGCRREELSRIAKRDYNTETITLHIAKRNIDIEHLIPDVLKPVFEAYHPAHLSPRALSTEYHQICVKAGVLHPEGWGWHSFRRMVETAVSGAIVANGLPESWIGVYMGWTPEEIGRRFRGAAMAGVYGHEREATTDPWEMERKIISIHPFLLCWLKPAVKATVVLK
jgi:integrase